MMTTWQGASRSVVAVVGVMACLALAACSGGESGSGSVASVTSPITGTFVDSPVNGLHYISVPSNPAGGVTANGGQYQCVPGDTVTFDLGGRVIGTGQPCGELVTVLSVFGATSITDLRVRNLAQLLLTLSGIPADSQPIELPASIPASLPARLDFSDPNFEQMLQAALSDRTLVSQEQVIAHLRTSFTTLTVVSNGGQITSIPAGLVCTTGTCSHDFVAGTQVTLAAVGTGFTGWTGAGCTGAGICQILLTATQAVRAVFLPPSPPPPPPPGGGGTLTITGAPASVGGKFTANPSLALFTLPSDQINSIVAVWGETPAIPPSIHVELISIAFIETINGPLLELGEFILNHNGIATLWDCESPCGITVDRSVGTVTFSNSVLTDSLTGAPPITLNGTLTFKPVAIPSTSLSIITASPLASGTVSQAYSVMLTTSGGTQPFAWSVISGALPAGFNLNATTGLISGTTTAIGTFTFTIRVQDNSTPPKSHEKQFSLTVNSSPPVGDPEILTITGAPASVGGTLVVSPSLTLVKPPDPQTNIASVVWSEAPTALPLHSEIVGIAFDATNNVPQASVIGFSLVHGSVITAWVCTDFITACGITVNGAAGTATFNSSVLSDIVSGAPPITLNGTLTFTPF